MPLLLLTVCSFSSLLLKNYHSLFQASGFSIIKYGREQDIGLNVQWDGPEYTEYTCRPFHESVTKSILYIKCLFPFLFSWIWTSPPLHTHTLDTISTKCHLLSAILSPWYFDPVSYCSSLSVRNYVIVSKSSHYQKKSWMRSVKEFFLCLQVTPFVALDMLYSLVLCLFPWRVSHLKTALFYVLHPAQGWNISSLFCGLCGKFSYNWRIHEECVVSQRLH